MDSIITQYSTIYPSLVKLAEDLKKNLEEYLSPMPRIDRITARAKSIERFSNKAKKECDGNLKYSNPLVQIQDQIGARIITYYLSDVEKVAEIIHKYYEPIEEYYKKPDRHDAFSYTSKHFILFIPDELRTWDSSIQMPVFFELQIKTLFQHAWAESEHDLNYKSLSEVNIDDKRVIAFSAAQAWGADKIFDDLFIKYNNPENGEKRK